MIFKYGTYSHAQNEVALTIQKRPVFDARGARQAIRTTWKLDGILQAASQAALTTAINNLQSAYNVDGLSAGLYLDDAVTPTSHQLETSQTSGGVRVTAIDFPEGEGAEYATFRSYTISLEADVVDTSSDLLTFHETITFSGGGPKFVFLQTLTGLPQRQRVAEQTPLRTIQTGSAVGRTGYPSPASPLWPAAEHREQRRVTLVGPKVTGDSRSEYEIEWQYTFESAGALVGLPGVR